MTQSDGELLISFPHSPSPAYPRLISMAALSLIGCLQQACGDDSLELTALRTSLNELTLEFESHER